MNIVTLSDFVTFKTGFNTWNEGVYSSALEHCRKIKFCEYIHQTHIHAYTNNEVFCMSDFVLCSKSYIFAVLV